MEELSYESFGGDCTDTILFIHSLFASAKEWVSTMFYIREKRRFHFLLPSLEPSQFSNSERCIVLLAKLIREKAKNGKAHVVGLSVGAHIAVLLAKDHPHLVETLNISGYQDTSAISQQLLPFGIYLAMKISTPGTRKKALSLDECYGITRTLHISNTARELAVPTSIFAGRPSWGGDNEDVAKTLAVALRHENCRIQVKGGYTMSHRWNVNHPDVYATVILAWIDNSWPEELKAYFRDL